MTAASRLVDEADIRIPLPERYHHRWQDPFDERVRNGLRAGAAVLDLGSGRNPTIAVDQRPPGTRYVGLDVSREELEAAPAGAYDEIVVADAATRVPALEGRFDLIVSWQVLEHVRSMQSVADNLGAYARPGARFVALLSGAYSAFGLINRILPNRLGHAVVARTMGRRSSNRPVFPAYYDSCTHRGLLRAFERWSHVEVVPLYRGATYFAFAPLLARTYLAYEDVVARTGRANLATHYLMEAVR